jgi:DNA-binding MarR family transcriptional regulator
MSDAFDDVLALLRATTSVTREIDRSVSAYHGIGLSDLQVLLELQDSPRGELARVELAERLGVAPSVVTRQLSPLERIGLVSRESHPVDARSAIVGLTPAGATMANDAARTAREAAERVVRPVLSDDERATLRRLLRTLS